MTISYSDRFFQKAKEVHGDTYDYSNSVYIGMLKHITIMCKIHGEFSQQAASHINGSGCKLCANIKRKQTNFEKYGGHPLQNKTVISNMRQTILDRYGVDHVLQDKNIKTKQEQTCLDRYGSKNAFQNKDLQDKQKATNLERYGVENVLLSEETQQKIKQTQLKKYGGHHTKLVAIQNKRKINEKINN